MSYFSVITCPGCGQKVTLTPEQISDIGGELKFTCRRCRHEGVLNADFVFKHPSKKNLTIREAMAMGKDGGNGLFRKLTSWLRG